MMAKYAKILLFLAGFILTTQVFGQYESKDNHTGYWDDAATWIDGSYEQDPVNDDYAVIEGLVEWEPEPNDSTLNFNLGGNPPGEGDSALVVRDTLIVNGNLNFANKNNLYIGEGGMLIIYGDLSGENLIEIDPNGYLIIEGNLIFNNENSGEISDGNGDNMYIGGDKENCTDTECNTINNDSTDLVSDSLDVYDYYKGQDPVNSGQYTIRPQSTDICDRSPQRVTLYFSDAESMDELYWQESPDGETYSKITGTDGQGSLTITSTETRFYRIQYSNDGGNTFNASDSAVVYCDNLCTLSASISLTSGSTPACYSEGISYTFEAEPAGASSYDWDISPATNSQNGDISITKNENQATFSNYTNPDSPSQEYTIDVTVSDEGCSDTASQTVTLQRRPETGNTYYVPNDFANQ
ncbi:MAG: hypothetical protein V5A47_12685 [Bacteroidales bacterium]|nr:hypothetical protein [Bacteroidales bacterium]MBS3776075.1 hypothetical protein [Bacteroidales bacterium]